MNSLNNSGVRRSMAVYRLAYSMKMPTMAVDALGFSHIVNLGGKLDFIRFWTTLYFLANTRLSPERYLRSIFPLKRYPKTKLCNVNNTRESCDATLPGCSVLVFRCTPGSKVGRIPSRQSGYAAFEMIRFGVGRDLLPIDICQNLSGSGFAATIAEGLQLLAGPLCRHFQFLPGADHASALGAMD